MVSPIPIIDETLNSDDDEIVFMLNINISIDGVQDCDPEEVAPTVDEAVSIMDRATASVEEAPSIIDRAPSSVEEAPSTIVGEAAAAVEVAPSIIVGEAPAVEVTPSIIDGATASVGAAVAVEAVAVVGAAATVEGAAKFIIDEAAAAIENVANNIIEEVTPKKQPSPPKKQPSPPRRRPSPPQRQPSPPQRPPSSPRRVEPPPPPPRRVEPPPPPPPRRVEPPPPPPRRVEPPPPPPPPPPRKRVSKYNPGDRTGQRIYNVPEPHLSLSVRDGEIILANSNSLDKNQHWIIYEEFSTGVKDIQGKPSFSISNIGNGKTLQYSIGHNHPIRLIKHLYNEIDKSVLWTSEYFGDSSRTIRRVTKINHEFAWDRAKVILYNFQGAGHHYWKITNW